MDVVRAVALAAFLAGAAGEARPQAPAREAVSVAPEKTSVVIYRDRPIDTWTLRQRNALDEEDDESGSPAGLALIVEERTVTLPAGRSTVRFRGVAEGMIPQSARVEGLADAALERNYDFDLLSPAALIERALGQPVRRVRTNPETGAETVERGVLRSGPAGVVIDFGGRLEALGCSGGPERLVFDRLPPGLVAEPTLSVAVDSARAGRRTVRLSYLAVGLQWAADYVARVRPDGHTLDLQGWITLANQGRTGFREAETFVVAGNLNRVEDEQAPEAEPATFERGCWPMDTTTRILPSRIPTPLIRLSREEFEESDDVEAVVVTGSRIIAKLAELGDYKLYSLPEPTTVAARQTKQVLFLDQQAVPFERRYVALIGADGEPDDGPSAEIVLRLENTTAGGLGLPLPGGTVSVTERGPAGRPLLVGQARPRDIPVGLPLELAVGRSPDVQVRSRLLQPLGRDDPRRLIEAVVTNAKTEPVVVEVVQDVYREAFRVFAEDRPHTVRHGAPVWTFSVPANGRASVRYTVELAD